MRVVGIKVLKNRLSEYIRLVRDGEVVLVTDRDRVVAELRPPEPDRPRRRVDAQLAEAGRRGWIREGVDFLDGPPPKPRGIAPLEQVLAWLDEDRADRFE